MFTNYRPNHGYDDEFSGVDQPRQALQPLLLCLGSMELNQLNHNQAAAMLFKQLGASLRLNDWGSQEVGCMLPFGPLPRLNRR